MSKNTIQLTDRELEAVLWAIQMAQDSYAGWTAEDKGPETVQDLKALARAEARIWDSSNARAAFLKGLSA